MNTFTFERLSRPTDAASAVAPRPGAMFLAGGTTLVDLMKVDVLTPDTVVEVRHLGLSSIDVSDQAIAVGAAVTNSQLAWHPAVRDRFPVLSQAILSGATTQIRNMATVAGNLLQRTRCSYFRDVHASCNRRQPGSGCDALDGFNRGHAVLGVSDHCIATHPSDMCVAMAVLDAEVHTVRADGTKRSIPFGEFHKAPGDTPHVEVALAHGELITHVVIPHLAAARRSHYLKVRDRASYEFALASAAVVLDLDGDTIRAARLGLGGIATRPWRANEAESFLTGREASDESFRDAAEIALTGAAAREHNHFKIELGEAHHRARICHRERREHMSTTTTIDVVGTPLDRVDGRLKVMGAATYPIDVTLPGLAHAVLVQSTVTSGRIRHIAVDAAQRAPGVLAVITHRNRPRLSQGPVLENGPQPLPPFQSDAVRHDGQHVAMVVAETREQANAAAALIEVTYERDAPVLGYEDPKASRVSHPWTPDYDRGDVASALAAADLRINLTYTTAANTNNPIGLFGTVAVWDGDALTVHDTTQYPHAVRESLAAAFGIDPAGVRVLVPFVGGAFGAGLRVWPHVPLAALAARITKRPVKLVLTRAQMFTSIGHRPHTIQQVSIGASRAGQLTAIEHVSRSSIGMVDELINLVTNGTPTAYACPNVSTRATQIRQSIPIPGWMRAPGEAEGSFALESAIDELRTPGHRSHRVAC